MVKNWTSILIFWKLKAPLPRTLQNCVHPLSFCIKKFLLQIMVMMSNDRNFVIKNPITEKCHMPNTSFKIFLEKQIPLYCHTHLYFKSFNAPPLAWNSEKGKIWNMFYNYQWMELLENFQIVEGKLKSWKELGKFKHFSAIWKIF